MKDVSYFTLADGSASTRESRTSRASFGTLPAHPFPASPFDGHSEGSMDQGKNPSRKGAVISWKEREAALTEEG